MMTVLTAVTLLVFIAIIFGGLLGYAAVRFKSDEDPVIEQINTILPQTQCGQCGYPGCKPYATAIAEQDEAINKCPPGGEAGIEALAKLLGKDAIPLDDSLEQESQKTVVLIRESECIGCTKCIQACPVDAILGAPKQMHTVISQECTGCNLCIPPCPVDCIDIIPTQQPLPNWNWNITVVNEAASK